MAIDFEVVTGNQSSANVLAQINNNFKKINSNPVAKADFATNADTVDNKHASELIPGAATFLNSITSLDSLSIGRYFCTQTRQSWEPVITTGSRTFLIEVSLNTANNLKNYKINYIAGVGAGESYYSNYKNSTLDWNRTVTDENIEKLVSIYNYFIFNNRKIQPLLIQDGFYAVEKRKTANFITTDGTRYFTISASAPVNNMSTITIKMYNVDTDNLLATQTVTQSASSTPKITNCFSDNDTILFSTIVGTQQFEYVITFSENSISIVVQKSVSSLSDIFTVSSNPFKYVPGTIDNSNSNDNYIVKVKAKTYNFNTTISQYYGYNKLTNETFIKPLGSFPVSSYNLYPRAESLFISKNANILCGIGEEDNGTGSNTVVYRPGAFIFDIDSETLTRLKLSSIHANLDNFSTSHSGSVYGGVVIIGDFVYISANFKYEDTNAASGIFKFNITNGDYIGQIPYDDAGHLDLYYKDNKTILCYNKYNSNIFEIDIDSFTIKNNYQDKYKSYILAPDKTVLEEMLSPPLLLNDKYHKIAINKRPSETEVSKIDYYMGYSDYWIDIGGF